MRLIGLAQHSLNPSEELRQLVPNEWRQGTDGLSSGPAAIIISTRLVTQSCFALLRRSQPRAILARIPQETNVQSEVAAPREANMAQQNTCRLCGATDRWRSLTRDEIIYYLKQGQDRDEVMEALYCMACDTAGVPHRGFAYEFLDGMMPWLVLFAVAAGLWLFVLVLESL